MENAFHWSKFKAHSHELFFSWSFDLLLINSSIYLLFGVYLSPHQKILYVNTNFQRSQPWNKKHFHFFQILIFENPVFLKFVSAIFIKFLFFHQMIALQNLWKMFFISSKKLFSFSRYSTFCIVPFLSTFSRFQRTSGSGIVYDVMNWLA